MNTEAAVVPITGRMTESEYDKARAFIRTTYGDNRQQAAIHWEQALARLFSRSGWTQEQLAAKEGKGHSWIGYRLCFGRFLAFSENSTMVENLTERHFRQYWERTDKAERNERIRFAAVAKMIEADVVLLRRPARPQIGRDIKEHFADGKWHQLPTIIAKIGGDPEHVEDTIEAMHMRATFGVKVEKKKVGTHFEYRIFPLEKTISSVELIEKLSPIIKGLKTEGITNRATMSPGTVAHLAGLLQKLLDEWTE